MSDDAASTEPAASPPPAADPTQEATPPEHGVWRGEEGGGRVRVSCPGLRPTPPPPLLSVVVWLRATGDAPILKQQKVRVPAADPFGRLVAALRARTGRATLFVYVREAFVPCLDDSVGALAAAYGGGDRLTVNYSTTPAWG